jgi:hypothetical protein
LFLKKFWEFIVFFKVISQGPLHPFDPAKLEVYRRVVFSKIEKERPLPPIEPDVLSVFFSMYHQDAPFPDGLSSADVRDLQALILSVEDSDKKIALMKKFFEWSVGAISGLGDVKLTKQMRDDLVVLEREKVFTQFGVKDYGSIDLSTEASRMEALRSFSRDNFSKVEYAITVSVDPLKTVVLLLKDCETILSGSSDHREQVGGFQTKLLVFQHVLPFLLAKLKHTSSEYLERQKASVKAMKHFLSCEALCNNLVALRIPECVASKAFNVVLKSVFGKAFGVFCDEVMSIVSPGDIDLAKLVQSYNDKNNCVKGEINKAMKTFLANCGHCFTEKDKESLSKKDLVDDESYVAITLTNLFLDKVYQQVIDRYNKVGGESTSSNLRRYMEEMKGAYFVSKDVYFGQAVGDFSSSEHPVEDRITTSLPFLYPRPLVLSHVRETRKFESNYALLKPVVCCASREYVAGSGEHPGGLPVYRSGTYGVFKADSKSLSHYPPGEFRALKAELGEVFVSLQKRIVDSHELLAKLVDSNFEPKIETSVLDRVRTLLCDQDGFSAAVNRLSQAVAQDMDVMGLLVKYLYSLNRAVSHLQTMAEDHLLTHPDMAHLCHSRMGAIRGSDDSESVQLSLETRLASLLNGRSLNVSFQGQVRPIEISIIYTNIPHNRGTVEAERSVEVQKFWRPQNSASVEAMRTIMNLYRPDLENREDGGALLWQEMSDVFKCMERHFCSIPFNDASGSLLPIAQLLQSRLIDLFYDVEKLLHSDGHTVYVKSVHCKSGLDRTAVLVFMILYMDSLKLTWSEIESLYSAPQKHDESIAHHSSLGSGPDHSLLMMLLRVLNMRYWAESCYVTATKPNVVSPIRTSWMGIPVEMLLSMGEEFRQG